MANAEIPVIPHEILEVLNKKTFSASDIKWIKTVNDNSTGNPASSSAYLPPDPRVIKKENGLFFCLQANKNSENTLNKANIGDLILIYQKLEKQTVKCFTHLVTPVGSGVVPRPYENDDWNGRWVKVIAMTTNKATGSIRALTTDWSNMPFQVYLKYLSYPNSAIWKIANKKNLSGKPLSDEELTNLQNYVWDKFKSYMHA
jgi:hypothetical protein